MAGSLCSQPRVWIITPSVIVFKAATVSPAIWIPSCSRSDDFLMRRMSSSEIWAPGSLLAMYWAMASDLRRKTVGMIGTPSFLIFGSSAAKWPRSKTGG